jgi:hypothetical protein
LHGIFKGSDSVLLVLLVGNICSLGSSSVCLGLGLIGLHLLGRAALDCVV